MNLRTESRTLNDPRLFRALLDEVNDAIYIIDPATGKLLDANRCAWQSLGCSRSELLSMSVEDLFHDVDGLESANGHLRNLKGMGPISFERVHERKDKSTFPVEVRLSLTELDGEEYVIAVARDITDRKQAEEVQRLSHERLRKVVDSALDAVVMMDPDGKTILWNTAAEKMFGYSASEMIGKDFHPFIMPDRYKEQQSKAFKHFQKTGDGDVIGSTRELVAKRKGGDTFPIELSISAVPLGGKLHAVGIVRDISDRVRRDQKFQSTVLRYVAMLDTVPAHVYLKDTDQKYTAANKAFCENISKSQPEIVGRTDYDLFPKELADRYREADQAVMDDNVRVTDHEKPVRDSQGETSWITTTRVPLHDTDGSVTGVVGLVQDVTELHKSREQLVQSDKLAAIGTLAAGVAHEINNPIGFISSNLNTMQKYLQKMVKQFESLTDGDGPDDEKMKDMTTDFGEAIEESIEGTGRIRDIVADLKSFSRVDKAEKENASLNDGIESTLNIVWNELKYNCKVEKKLGDIPDIYCMPNQLNQVFMNILVNAGHAVQHDHGLIKIGTWADDENVYISIEDNGTGIPPENLGKLFEPFFTTKEVGKGTGLGLSLAYDIVSKHGGQIEVQSEVGEGTKFTISLPKGGLKDE